MNKKLKIALYIIVGVLSIVSLVGYIFWKEQTTYIFECIIDFINRPLPIVGVSTVIVLGFVYKIFVSTKYGKKALKELNDDKDKFFGQAQEYKKNLDEQTELTKALVNAHQQEIDLLKNYLVELCELSPNVKLKELGEKIKQGYDLKTTEIVNDLGSYSDSFIIAKVNSQEELINALKEQFEKEIELLREELENGKETTNSDTEEE